MAYNSPLATTTSYGVVEIGSNIQVSNGVISIPQSVATTANPVFATVTSTGAVTDSGNRVITSLIAGTNITITGTAPSLTINASSTPTYNTKVISSSYTANASDYYIGVVASGPVTITLPAGSDGDTYVIKSEYGNTGDITVTTTALDKIEGSSNYSITAATLGSITVIYRGTNWNVV